MSIVSLFFFFFIVFLMGTLCYVLLCCVVIPYGFINFYWQNLNLAPYQIFRANIVQSQMKNIWAFRWTILGFHRQPDAFIYYPLEKLLRYGGGGFVAQSFPTLVTPWTIAHQASLSMGFPRQGYWSGCHFLLQRILPTQGLNPSPTLQVDSLPLSHEY